MENILFEKKEQIGYLTINRPHALNALNMAVFYEIRTLLQSDEIQGVKVLILTGSGEKAFVAGADIKEMNSLSYAETMRFSELGQDVMYMIETMDIVSIAAVNGFALGGGLELALCCDFAYASDNAKLGFPEVTLGLIPGFAGTMRLPRIVGERKAKELIFSAKTLSAEEALQIGLVNKVCPQNELMSEVEKVASKICRNGFFAVTQAKRAINKGYNLSSKEAMELEKHMFGLCFTTEESTEGINAFLEKRKPDFK
jgi:enoyl-CoA hydratase